MRLGKSCGCQRRGLTMTKSEHQEKALDTVALLEQERAHSARLMRDLGELQKERDAAKICAWVLGGILALVLLF